jgi:hypothetical protein
MAHSGTALALALLRDVGTDLLNYTRQNPNNTNIILTAIKSSNLTVYKKLAKGLGKGELLNKN